MPPSSATSAPAAPSSGRVSKLETHVGFWLRFVSNHVSGRFQGLVEQEGVSVSEWVALRHLLEPETTSPAALIEVLGMTKGAVSKIITRLEEKGLVSRNTLEADRRSQIVELTMAGRQLLPRLAALADQNDQQFFGHLAPAQREQLITIMQEIVRLQHLKSVPVD